MEEARGKGKGVLNIRFCTKLLMSKGVQENYLFTQES